MNNTNLRGKDFEAKEEEINNNTNNESNLFKLASSSSTSTRQWAGSRNPRIVRVSRASGGKDRHSKVCTIRGLRDRRIRLSVPVAIQLYDLQDRLGVGQPSKVVDWLLDVTKDDIDKLPPLQIPPHGDFSQFLEPLTRTSHASSFPTILDAHNNSLSFFKGGININDGEDQDQEIGVSSKSKNAWEFGVDGEFLRAKDKEQEGYHMKIDQNRGDHGIGSSSTSGYDNENNAQNAVQNFFPVGSNSSMPVYLNNMMMPYNNNPQSYYQQWDPSNLSLSQFGGLQGQDPHSHQNSTQDPNVHSSSLPSGSQLLFYPPTATIPSMFPSYSPFFATQLENNVPRQMNHFQEGSSSNAQQNNFPRSFQLSLRPDKLISSQKMNETEEEEEEEEEDTDD